MGTAIFLFALAGFLIYSARNKMKENAKMKEMGFDLDNKIDVGKYIAGHPDIDKPSERMSIVKKDGYLELIPLIVDKGFNFPKIEMVKIKNVTVEDKSILEKRVTATRILLTGVLAFAWKKKTKDEFAYLVIEWNDDRFDHETIFEYTNKGAFERANTARNQLMRSIR